jgi:hypothetical protein
MKDALWLSFQAAIPLIIEIFIIYDRHRIELFKKSIKYVLDKKDQIECRDVLLTTCKTDYYPYLRRILNPIEEFNLNLFFLISVFIGLLLINNENVRTVTLTFLVGLLFINGKMSLKACKTCHKITEANSQNKVLRHFRNRSVLLYAFCILGLTLVMNFTILILFL